MSIQALEALDLFDGEEVEYYYDTHPTERDLMGDSYEQDTVMTYLAEVLKWFCASEGWYIARNLNLFFTGFRMENPRAPDIAVFKGVAPTLAQRRKIKSWRVHPPSKPAPSVVFEIISDNSPERDLVDKPVEYAGTGIREYFCYGPRVIRKKGERRLHGWRYSGKDAEAIEPDEQGRLWSEELDSWLVPDGLMLRLTDADGNLRLTGEEAQEREKEQARREAAQARREVQRERREKEQARRDAERERVEKQESEERERLAREEVARARDDAARERAENERLHALLRLPGRDIDGDGPDVGR